MDGKWRKMLVAGFAVVLILAWGLTGCSGEKEGGESSQPTTSGTAASETGATPQTSPGLPKTEGKYDPPVSLSSAKALTASVTFKNNETVDNNVATRWLLEKTGIRLEFPLTAPDAAGEDTKLQLALSSNDRLPDVIVPNTPALGIQLANSGRIYDNVKELFDKYANDNVKKAYDQAGKAIWSSVTVNGKVIALPIVVGNYNEQSVLWVRQDWLKKLNLQEPTTLEELEAVLDAFTNKDPDGNGKKDTFGLVLSTKDSLSTWTASPGFVFSAFKTLPQQWNKAEDGTIVYGGVDSRAKDALAVLNRWHEKGYMNQDAGAIDITKAGEYVMSGKAGIIAGPFWFDLWPLAGIDKAIPGAELKVYPLPAGPDGNNYPRGTLPVAGNYYLTKDMEHPEIFFDYLNALYDGVASQDVADGEWEKGKFQGYDYDIADGEVTTDTAQIPGGSVLVNNYFITNNFDYPNRTMDIFSKLATGQTPQTYSEKASARAPLQIQAFQAIFAQKDNALINVYQGSLTDTMTTKNEFLNKLELETFNKIIYGKMKVEEFDTYVSQWKQAGGETITREVNDWYKETVAD